MKRQFDNKGNNFKKGEKVASREMWNSIPPQYSPNFLVTLSWQELNRHLFVLHLQFLHEIWKERKRSGDTSYSERLTPNTS